MNLRMSAVFLFALALATRGVEGQSRADFSGSWIATDIVDLVQPGAVPPKEGARKFPLRPAYGPTFKFVQSATVLVLQRSMGEGRFLETVYLLDGRESKNDELVETVSVATWRDGRLHLSTRFPTGTVIHELRLRGGDELVVETWNDLLHWETIYRRQLPK